MTIKRITGLLSSPINSSENNNLNWVELRREIGLDVPVVYKDFLSVYGTGVIAGFLWILNPFSNNANLNLEKMRHYQDAYEEMKLLFPEDYARPRFPSNNSFFVWAITDNGDSVFWIIDQMISPDSWKVGIHGSDQGEEELTGFTTLEFLEALLENRLESNILDSEFLLSDKIFEPCIENKQDILKITGRMIEVTKSQNRYSSATGGVLHIPGSGSPVRQPNYAKSYWKERYQNFVNLGRINE